MNATLLTMLLLVSFASCGDEVQRGAGTDTETLRGSASPPDSDREEADSRHEQPGVPSHSSQDQRPSEGEWIKIHIYDPCADEGDCHPSGD